MYCPSVSYTSPCNTQNPEYNCDGGWTDLPKELYQTIFQKLTPGDLVSCSLTCWVWRNIATENRIGEPILQKHGIIPKKIENWTASYSKWTGSDNHYILIDASVSADNQTGEKTGLEKAIEKAKKITETIFPKAFRGIHLYLYGAEFISETIHLLDVANEFFHAIPSERSELELNPRSLAGALQDVYKRHNGQREYPKPTRSYVHLISDFAFGGHLAADLWYGKFDLPLRLYLHKIESREKAIFLSSIKRQREIQMEHPQKRQKLTVIIENVDS